MWRAGSEFAWTQVMALRPVREIFGRFLIEEVTTTYTIGSNGAQTDRRELVIRG